MIMSGKETKVVNKKFKGPDSFYAAEKEGFYTC